MRDWGRWDDAAGRAGVWPDVVLAAALTLGGQLELVSSGQAGWRGLGHALLLLLQTAPVAGRRVAPALAATLSAVGLGVEALAMTPTNTLSALLAGLILLYSLGRHARGRRLPAATALSALALIVHAVRLPGAQVADLAFTIIFAATAWLIGRTMVRREQERARAAAEAQASQSAAAAAVQAAVVDERSRIARELHDVVAHGMGVMVVQAAAAEQLLDTDPQLAREPLSAVRQTGQGALAEMRRLLGLLNDGGDGGDGDPADPQAPQPGLADLPHLITRLRAAGMPVTYAVTGSPDEAASRVAPGLQLCAYRIVQEALTNSLKHSGAAATQVSIDHRPEALTLRVSNEPGTRAAAAPAQQPGHGLVGMRERVRLYGGSVHAGPQADGSFVVVAALPIQP